MFTSWFVVALLSIVALITNRGLRLVPTGFAAYIEAAVVANQPTPWMGATERASQYAMNLWYAVFAVKLLRQHDDHCATSV